MLIMRNLNLISVQSWTNLVLFSKKIFPQVAFANFITAFSVRLVG